MTHPPTLREELELAADERKWHAPEEVCDMPGSMVAQIIDELTAETDALYKGILEG